jgi:hypothetical protein
LNASIRELFKFLESKMLEVDTLQIKCLNNYGQLLTHNALQLYKKGWANSCSQLDEYLYNLLYFFSNLGKYISFRELFIRGFASLDYCYQTEQAWQYLPRDLHPSIEDMNLEVQPLLIVQLAETTKWVGAQLPSASYLLLKGDLKAKPLSIKVDTSNFLQVVFQSSSGELYVYNTWSNEWEDPKGNISFMVPLDLSVVQSTKGPSTLPVKPKLKVQQPDVLNNNPDIELANGLTNSPDIELANGLTNNPNIELAPLTNQPVGPRVNFANLPPACHNCIM